MPQLQQQMQRASKTARDASDRFPAFSSSARHAHKTKLAEFATDVFSVNEKLCGEGEQQMYKYVTIVPSISIVSK